MCKCKIKCAVRPWRGNVGLKYWWGPLSRARLHLRVLS